MPRSLALFDFDGTITTKDTFIEFIRFVKGDVAVGVGFVLLAPILVAYKLRLIPNWRAKEIVFGYFFKNMLYTDFEEYGQRFATEALPKLLRKSAIHEILKLAAEKWEIFIVTASAAEWIRPWSEPYSITLLATKWEVIDGKITGRIEGKNCYGEEKSARIQKETDLNSFTEIYAYGDTKGDREMLALATKKHYRFFGA